MFFVSAEYSLASEDSLLSNHRISTWRTIVLPGTCELSHLESSGFTFLGSPLPSGTLENLEQDSRYLIDFSTGCSVFLDGGIPTLIREEPDSSVVLIDTIKGDAMTIFAAGASVWLCESFWLNPGNILAILYVREEQGYIDVIDLKKGIRSGYSLGKGCRFSESGLSKYLISVPEVTAAPCS